MPTYRAPDPLDVPGAWYDPQAVQRVVRAIAALRHTKGVWAGQPFVLQPWQVEHVIAPVFGWKGPDGRRIRRRAWIEVPRKNGKSTLAAAIGLVHLLADGEAGAEVYAAAASKDQARAVFDEASRMARACPLLRGKVKVLRNAIVVPASGGVWRVLSRDGEPAHGRNVHAAVIDEVHVHRDRGVIEALETSTAARSQPVVWYITTADQGDRIGPYEELHGYAVQVATGSVNDPTFYAAIYTAPDHLDSFDERAWEMANPNLDVTVPREFLRSEAARARMSGAFRASYERLYLNRRVRVTHRWLPLDTWDRCADPVDPEALAGRDCWVGLDLASTRDLTAVVAVIADGDGYAVMPYFFVPRDRAYERSLQAPYLAWSLTGHLTLTDGNVVDYNAIRACIHDLAARYRVREVAYDPWAATQLAQQLQDEDSMTVVAVRQSMAGMSAATKELMRLVEARKLRHGGHPVLRWMADNMVLKVDHNGNVKPDRERSVDKIDGMVALVMAIARASVASPLDDGWYYA